MISRHIVILWKWINPWEYNEGLFIIAEAVHEAKERSAASHLESSTPQSKHSPKIGKALVKLWLTPRLKRSSFFRLRSMGKYSAQFTLETIIGRILASEERRKAICERKIMVSDERARFDGGQPTDGQATFAWCFVTKDRKWAYLFLSTHLICFQAKEIRKDLKERRQHFEYYKIWQLWYLQVPGAWPQKLFPGPFPPGKKSREVS